MSSGKWIRKNGTYGSGIKMRMKQKIGPESRKLLTKYLFDNEPTSIR